MTFGEKLYKLRKEKGLSQEALAEKLNTTRQAVSKWENGQGYPETEKILMIGNLFEVSIDYLLKETSRPSEEMAEGYYVSKEMAEGFLMNQHKVSKYSALGLFVVALAFIPYFFFEGDPAKFALPTIIVAIIGFGIYVSAMYLEEDQYKILRQEPLLLDEKYQKELMVRYKQLTKKYAALILIGVSLFLLGLLPIAFDRKGFTSGFFVPYYPLCIASIAVGVYILTRALALDGYYLLVKNKEYVNRVSFKLKRKARKKVEEL